MVFVDNHDTERNGSTLSYADGADYSLANVLMLAGTYGTPAGLLGLRVQRPRRRSGAGCRRPRPRRGLPGRARPGREPADGDWVCQHRWPAVEGMIGWRAVAGDAPVSDAWHEGDGVAFGRGDRAFVVVNAGDAPLAATLATSLPDGRYCDVLTGPVASGKDCPGAELVVKDGSVRVTVPPDSAQAWDVASRR